MISLSKIFYDTSCSHPYCHFQFTEFVHTIQALQIELADVKEGNATSNDESRDLKKKDASQPGKNVERQLDVSGDSQTHDSASLPNGNLENDSSSLSLGNALAQVGQVDLPILCRVFFIEFS